MDRAVWKNIVPAIAFGFIMLFFIINDVNTWTNESKGTYVEGHVVDTELDFVRRHSRRGSRSRYDITVHYTVDGVTYECFFENQRTRWVDGQRVELYYLGEPGGEVFLASRNPKFIWILPMFAMIFFIIRAKNTGVPIFGSQIAEEVFFGESETSEERDQMFLNELQTKYRNK